MVDHRLESTLRFTRKTARKNVQDGFFDPQGQLGNQAFETNGPDYRVRGARSKSSHASPMN